MENKKLAANTCQRNDLQDFNQKMEDSLTIFRLIDKKLIQPKNVEGKFEKKCNYNRKNKRR